MKSRSYNQCRVNSKLVKLSVSVLADKDNYTYRGRHTTLRKFTNLVRHTI